jgi:transposase-like protein
MTTGDIEAHIHYIYGIEVSTQTSAASRIMNTSYRREWQMASAGNCLCGGFLGCHPLPCRSEGQIVKKAVYIAFGIDLDGKKDVLGLWVGLK